MRTRREVIKAAEQIVGMLYEISNTRRMSPESVTPELVAVETQLITRLDTLNWVLGPDAVTL